jgi:hypothetical protein
MAKYFFYPGPRIEILPSIFIILIVIYAGIIERLDVLVLGLGVALICYSNNIPLYNTLYLIAISIFLGSYLSFGQPNEIIVDERFVPSHKMPTRILPVNKAVEGFANNEEDDEMKEDEKEEFEDKDENKDFEDKDVEEDFDDEEEEDEDEAEGFANPPKNEVSKKKKTKKNLPPNNGDRAEKFELGKKYKIPTEDDDEDYHLDAGTTFLNAYKSLNPDQISAMTKDTQELINTQKQLMSTLNTLKPLITDGKQMMETFGSYFGGEGGQAGDLSKMAEKFISK